MTQLCLVVSSTDQMINLVTALGNAYNNAAGVFQGQPSLKQAPVVIFSMKQFWQLMMAKKKIMKLAFQFFKISSIVIFLR